MVSCIFHEVVRIALFCFLSWAFSLQARVNLTERVCFFKVLCYLFDAWILFFFQMLDLWEQDFEKFKRYLKTNLFFLLFTDSYSTSKTLFHKEVMTHSNNLRDVVDVVTCSPTRYINTWNFLLNVCLCGDTAHFSILNYFGSTFLKWKGSSQMEINWRNFQVFNKLNTLIVTSFCFCNVFFVLIDTLCWLSLASLTINQFQAIQIELLHLHSLVVFPRYSL